MALKFHPDKNKEAEAEERFKEIGEAYEVLRQMSSLFWKITWFAWIIWESVILNDGKSIIVHGKRWTKKLIYLHLKQ